MKRKVLILVQQLLPKRKALTYEPWNMSVRLRGRCRLPHKLYPSRFMPGKSVVPTLAQKRSVFPAFLSREVTSGQMRKIGIHFIIHPCFSAT